MFLVDPARCARGAVAKFTPVNTGLVGLFNNASQWYLAVMMIISGPDSTNPLGISITQTRLGTQGIGTISPVISGNQVPPGLLDRDDVASPPASDFYMNLLGTGPANIGNEYPIAVLRPGWELVVSAAAAASALDAAFFWCWITPDQVSKPRIGNQLFDQR